MFARKPLSRGIVGVTDGNHIPAAGVRNEGSEVSLVPAVADTNDGDVKWCLFHGISCIVVRKYDVD